jgi:hypothetical protein
MAAYWLLRCPVNWGQLPAEASARGTKCAKVLTSPTHTSPLVEQQLHTLNGLSTAALCPCPAKVLSTGATSATLSCLFRLSPLLTSFTVLRLFRHFHFAHSCGFPGSLFDLHLVYHTAQPLTSDTPLPILNHSCNPPSNRSTRASRTS